MSIAKMKGAKGKSDVIFSKLVRSINYCERCGTSEHLQCSHIMSRGYSHTRTDFNNAQSLCAKCHYYFTNNPIEFTKWVYSTVGQNEYERVRKIALDGIGQKFDWDAELIRLKELYKQMEAGEWHRNVVSVESAV